MKLLLPLDINNKLIYNAKCGGVMQTDIIDEKCVDYKKLAKENEEFHQYILDKYAEPTATEYYNSKIGYFQSVVDFATKYNIEKLASLARGYVAISKYDEIVDYSSLKKIDADYGSFKKIANSLLEKVDNNLYLAPKDVTTGEAYLNIVNKLKDVDVCASNLTELYYYAYSGETLLPTFVESDQIKSSDVPHNFNK